MTERKIFFGKMKNFFKNKIEFDDLIFANRNRDYGAYFLRKGYNSSVFMSIIIASLIVSAMVVIPFILTIDKQHKAGKEIRPRYVLVNMENIEPPKEEIIIPPSVDPPPPNKVENVKYVAPVLVDTVLPAAEKIMQTADAIKASDNNSTDLQVVGTGNNDELISGQSGEELDEPFMIVEVKPTFKGGDIEKFREWVQKRAIYPQIAQENGIQGRVFLTFVIERDGTVSNVKVVKGVDKVLDDEAVKAIMSSPKWTPGLQRGKPVRVRYSMPLVFSMGK
jgi:periplasmic protein TonB